MQPHHMALNCAAVDYRVDNMILVSRRKSDSSSLYCRRLWHSFSLSFNVMKSNSGIRRRFIRNSRLFDLRVFRRNITRKDDSAISWAMEIEIFAPSHSTLSLTLQLDDFFKCAKNLEIKRVVAGSLLIKSFGRVNLICIIETKCVYM